VSDPFPTCYLNGKYQPLAETRISPLDRGFLFADGVYEVLPVHRGRPFRLRAHLARLAHGQRAIGLNGAHDETHWLEIIQSLIEAAAAPELLVYLQVTRGAEWGRNHLLSSAAEPTVFAFASQYPVPDAATLANGMSVVTMADVRWARCDIKSIALLANVMLRQQAVEHDAAEALLIRDGNVTEGSSSSVLMVSGGRLITAPDSHLILSGTTRDALLELSRGWLSHDRRPIKAEELPDCEEVWIASSGRGVLPVTRVDGRPIGNGRPGSLWREMYARLQRHLDDLAAIPAL